MTSFSCKQKEVVLDAILIDDLSNIELKLYKNNTFEVSANTMFGTIEFDGMYKKSMDKIIFIDEPYDSDFIPKEVMIVDDKIILRKTREGKIDTSYASFFKIRESKFESN